MTTLIITPPQNLVDKPSPDVGILHKRSDSKTKQAQLLQELSDIKKANDEKLHQRRKLAFAIGLVLSLLFTLVAFEWKTYSDSELVDLGNLKADFDEITDVELTVQPPPPPPKTQLIQPQFVEVPDEVEIEEMEAVVDVEVTEDLAIADLDYDLVADDVPEEKVQEIFTIVEQQPEPVGGLQAFYKYVSETIKYPAAARRMGVSGRVYVRFVVEVDGSITNVEVMKGIGHGCDEEAVRVIAGAPAWKPGKQRGQPVRVYAMAPIFFTMKGN